MDNVQIAQHLHEELKLSPFGFLGSNRNNKDPRWLSYLVVTNHKQTKESYRHSLKASGFEKAFLAMMLRVAGKYPMYRRQDVAQLMIQIFVNGLMGGDFLGNMKYLRECFWSRGKPAIKRLLFQCPAEIDRDGIVTHCLNCPDAVLRNGRLVPVCISDKVNG
jgi:hypothetical protein